MQINKLFGKLTPAHPYFVPVIKAIREKYNFPEIAPGDETLAEILNSEEYIDPEILRQDIEAEIRKNPELLPPETASIYRLLHAKEESNLDLTGLDDCPPKVKKEYMALLDLTVLLLEPYLAGIDSVFSGIADNLLEYLLTGETRDLPEQWFQTVSTMNMMGEPVIVAICGQAGDPKETARLLKAEYTKTFGKDRPKFTNGQRNTAEYLRMKLEGKPIAYLVDIYAENNPSQFPTDFRSKEYKAAKEKHYQLMKKRLQRLQKQVNKMLGTKTG